MELSTVAQKVTILLKQEQGFLTLAAKNQTEADIRAFRIGELIWTEILHGKRGQRGEGQLTKFLPQVGLQKSAAYNYVNLYRGAENIMGEDWASTPEQNFRNNPLPREYWQILGSTFNDDTYFSDFVREELCLRPLLTDGKVDKKLLAEAAELFRRHRKKPGFWNPKRSEMKVKRIYDDEHGYIEGYFDDNDPDDVAAGAKIEKQQMAWEHDLGKLVGEDRSLWSPGSPRWKSDKRLTIPEIAGQAREAEQAVVVDDFTQKLAKVRRKSKVRVRGQLYTRDINSFASRRELYRDGRPLEIHRG